MTGFMPDYAGVYANTTVREYLDFFARANGLRGDERRTAVSTIIEFMGIGDIADRGVTRCPRGFSSGLRSDARWCTTPTS